MHIEDCYGKEKRKLCKTRSYGVGAGLHDLLLNFGTPLLAEGFNENYAELGHRGLGAGKRDPILTIAISFSSGTATAIYRVLQMQ